MNTQEMPRSNLAKTMTLRVSLVPRLQVYHKDEIKKDPRVTSEDFGGFLNDKLELLLEKEEYAKSNFPNCSILSISDNVIYIKDRVLRGIVEVYYVFLNDLMISRLFCQYDESFSCVHIVYACTTLEEEAGPRCLQGIKREDGQTIHEGNQGKISKKNQPTGAK